MSNRKKLFTQAAQKAKELLQKLGTENNNSTQWKYEQIDHDIKSTYKALKLYSQGSNKDLIQIQNYLSEEGLALLAGNSEKWVNVQWLNLLKCFEYKLEDIAIISIINFPGSEEDKLFVWLDHEINSSEADDIETDRVDELEDFDSIDEFKMLSGFNIKLLNCSLLGIAGTNDLWIFAWSETKNKWVLDFLGNDLMADNYAKTIGKSMNYTGYEFKYPKLT